MARDACAYHGVLGSSLPVAPRRSPALPEALRRPLPSFLFGFGSISLIISERMPAGKPGASIGVGVSLPLHLLEKEGNAFLLEWDEDPRGGARAKVCAKHVDLSRTTSHSLSTQINGCLYHRWYHGCFYKRGEKVGEKQGDLKRKRATRTDRAVVRSTNDCSKVLAFSRGEFRANEVQLESIQDFSSDTSRERARARARETRDVHARAFGEDEQRRETPVDPRCR